MKTGSKTPIPALYLELGVEPIRFILKRKRLIFLHHILNCDDNRLISQVFWAQERNPVKNDWVTTAKENLIELGLGYLSLQQIKNMKKEAFRGLIKIKCKKMHLNIY